MVKGHEKVEETALGVAVRVVCGDRPPATPAGLSTRNRLQEIFVALPSSFIPRFALFHWGSLG